MCLFRIESFGEGAQKDVLEERVYN